MELRVLNQRDRFLRETCPGITRTKLRSKEVQQEIDALLDVVFERQLRTRELLAGSSVKRVPRTVGLSANQVGSSLPVSILDLGIARKGIHETLVLVNPVVTWRSATMVERVEGCVNFPDCWGITRRPNRVRLEAWTRTGFVMTLDVNGWAAALVAHEIDHLNGVLFIDRLTDPTRAHYVLPDQFDVYRTTKMAKWQQYIDVSSEVREIPFHYRY